MTRIPNANSPVEIRKAFQQTKAASGFLLDGTLGQILTGAGANVVPAWGTDLTALTSLTVDNISIDGAVISSDSGAISFSNENLTTTGTVAGINVTSGANPGHTHTGTSLSGIDISDDTNLAVTSPIVLTGDTLSLNQGSIDHGSIGGLGDDDHTIYLLADGTRALTGNMSVDAGITIDGRDISADGALLDAIAGGKVAVDTDATPDFLGNAYNDGVLRTSTGITFTDGGNFVTLTTNDGEIVHDNLSGFVAAEHIDWTGASSNFDTSGTVTVVDHFTFLASGGQTYRLGLQCDVTGNNAVYDFYTADGDGTDDIVLNIFAKGSPTDWVPYEILQYRWDSAGGEFEIRSGGGGAGHTIRPLNIHTGSNSAQIYLKTDGYVGINNSNPSFRLDVIGTCAVTAMRVVGHSIREVVQDVARLAIQNRTTATHSLVDIYSRDGDGTDNVGLAVVGLGTPEDWTPYAWLSIKWAQAASEYSISTAASGTIDPLNIYTGGNSGQIYLKNDGCVGFSNSGPTRTVDITGTLAVSSNCTFSGTGHDSFTDMVANEHIDHTGVTLTAGSGIAGGGTIAASRSFDLDINSLAAAAIAGGDFVPFWDITATATNKKITFTNFEAALTHDNLIAGTIADHDTTATGANLTSLTDNSMVDALHRHSELSASDGTPDPALSIDATGQVGIGTASPAELLHLSSSTDHARMRLETTSAGSHNAVMEMVNPTGRTGAFVFYEGGTENANLRFIIGHYPPNSAFEVQTWTGAAWLDSFAIKETTGLVGIGTIAPDARCEIETGATEGTQAVTIDQNDIDKAFIDFQGESEAGAAKNISTWTAGNTIQGFVKQEVNGAEVWMPYYDAPTS